MYVCGPTVYDFSHIGHARTYISFDILKRYLEYCGYKVSYIINITDVDDKILDRAKKEGRYPQELSEEMVSNFQADFRGLGNMEPDEMPKVTDNIEDIIDFVKALIDKGHAYAANGDVYFSVRSFSSYGELSKNKIEELENGVRISTDENKHDPLDFALWKKSKSGEKLSFESPWGAGRPGWHIECSTLAKKYLGEEIDIHGGGNDLIFPHHEDERAQSEAVSEKQFAKYWVHTGMVTVRGQKMSKSLKNFITIKNLLEKWSKDVLRYHILKTHYRSPLDFSLENLASSGNSLQTIREFSQRLDGVEKIREDDLKMAKNYEAEFFAALDDDLNTPKAIAVLFEFIKEMNKLIATGKLNRHEKNKSKDFLKKVEEIFGLQLFSEEDIPEDIKDLAAQRETARKQNDYEEADRFRTLLEKKGYIVEDTASGPKVRRN